MKLKIALLCAALSVGSSAMAANGTVKLTFKGDPQPPVVKVIPKEGAKPERTFKGYQYPTYPSYSIGGNSTGSSSDGSGGYAERQYKSKLGSALSAFRGASRDPRACDTDAMKLANSRVRALRRSAGYSAQAESSVMAQYGIPRC